MLERLKKKFNATTNLTAKKLIQIMHAKQSNLAVSADCTDKASLLRLIETIGSEVCVVKTHIDIVKDFDKNLITELKALADHFNFLLFEDRKFADIGNTVRLQFEEGVYHIASWADLVNAHILPGEGIIQGLQQSGLEKGLGLLLLAQMSSKGHFFTPEYTAACLSLAKKYRAFVIGFISQTVLELESDFLYLTPGVHLASPGDSLGQQYRTPAQAVEAGADVLIVGRGITQTDDPLSSAKRYRTVCWEAYSDRRT